MKRKLLLLTVLMLTMVSCQTGKSLNTITPSINPVSKTVPPVLDREVYSDGVFFDKANYAKLELYVDDLNKEIELLRIELAKFEEN